MFMKQWDESWQAKRQSESRDLDWVCERRDIVDALFGLAPDDLDLDPFGKPHLDNS